MTTNVRVTTHDWAVEITPMDYERKEDGTFGKWFNELPPVIVPKDSSHDIAVWQGRELRIKELPRD